MAPPPGVDKEEEEEEDDYMNMTFADDAPGLATLKSSSTSAAGGGGGGGETSLQRRLRLKREGEARGRVKSKAELAAEAEAAREEALSRSLLEGARARRSKGLAMMARMGFKAGDALGSSSSTAEGGEGGEGRTREPIRLQMKEDRGGIGLDAERKRKMGEAAERQAKRAKADEAEYRERVRGEREEARREGLFYGAMKVCERLDEERAQGLGRDGDGDGADSSDNNNNNNNNNEVAEVERFSEGMDNKKRRRGKKTLSTRQLKSIPVEWRGLVRKRQEDERERDVHRMRYNLEQTASTPGLAAARLPTYADDLDGDEDDRRAVGKAGPAYASVEEDDLGEEDEELDAFGALEAGERLRRVVEYLRGEFRYCSWCKYQYPDEAMEGCPGSTEEDHD